MSKPITIAIDGHSSTGKSTLARQLANKLGFNYVDTGAMYRAVTLFAIKNGFFNPDLEVHKLIKALDAISLGFTKNDNTGRSDVTLNGKSIENQIRDMEVSSRVSEVAAVKEVREKLVAEQQLMGRNGGVVMDGRDIGTVVFPQAELKIFMTAKEGVRTERRLQELRNSGVHVGREEVASNIRRRDIMDSNRKDSPLRRAEDARVLDNSDMAPEEQLSMALEWAKEAIESAKE